MKKIEGNKVQILRIKFREARIFDFHEILAGE